MITDHTPESLIAFEADVAEAFNRGEIRAPVHLSGGNELQLLKIFEDVRPQDWIATNWRSHYACLLKGVPPDRLMADILAGRSITLNYPEHRIISSAIVGGILPIALGLAWSIKRSGEGARVWTFSGDMTRRTGIFHECTDYAIGHDLPITFITENNELSVCTPTAEVWGESVDPLGPVQFGIGSYDYILSWPHSGAGKRIEF